MLAPKGSKMPRGDQDHIMRFPVVPVDEAEEKEIGMTFSNIQKKIQINDKIINELQAAMETIYNYWFVQFDFPDIYGNPYKSSGGEMIWNSTLKQHIPKGWNATLLKRISSIINTSVSPYTTPDTSFWHYSIPAYDDWNYPASELGKDIESNKYIVPENAILVSKLNPRFKRIWKPHSVLENSICSTEFMPFVSTSSGSVGYLYGVLNSDAFYTYMVQCSSSSTGSRKRMQPDLCGEFLFPMPPESDIRLIQMFNDFELDCLAKQGKLREENQRLISLREFLLPTVMTGQVNFKGKA